MKISNIVHRATSELVPYAGNARTHPEHQLEAIQKGIEEYGFYNPVVVNEKGMIIAGHGRVMAAQRMGLATVPTITIEGLTDQQRRALTLYDNKTAQHAGWDLEKVREEIAALSNEDFDLELTGFLDHEIEAMLRDDKFILPDFENQLVPVIHTASLPIGGGSTARQPNVSDDNYSRFDLVMRHESKIELVELLNEIKNDMQFEKLEDALMEIAKFWKENR